MMIDKLVEHRKASGLTQQDVADQLGMRRSIYGKVETYDRRIDVIETQRICRILGIKVRDVLEGE